MNDIDAIVVEDEIFWIKLAENVSEDDIEDGFIDIESNEIVNLKEDGKPIAEIVSKASLPVRTYGEEIIDNILNEDGELMDHSKARGIVQNFFGMF